MEFTESSEMMGFCSSISETPIGEEKGHSGSDGNKERPTINPKASKIGGHGKTRPQDRKHQTIRKKELVGIPWMLAFEMRKRGWRIRQEIIWSKPNPMPESIKDRFTKSHEQIFMFVKSEKYYFDQEVSKGKSNRNPKVKRIQGQNHTQSNKEACRLAG